MAKANKTPDIYCRKGKPLGELSVTCNDAFQAEGEKREAQHGMSGLRVYEAADHLIRGLQHLTVSHNLDLAAAHKVATGAVRERHGLSAPAVQEAIKVVVAHWPRGTELQNVLLGRTNG